MTRYFTVSVVHDDIRRFRCLVRQPHPHRSGARRSPGLVGSEHAQNTEPLFTTDYIVDETLTLLRARGQNRRAITVGSAFVTGSAATVHFITWDDFVDAWEVFRRFSDKEWSFTDCTSKVVMERLGLTTAFSFDRHFLQFGTIRVVP